MDFAEARELRKLIDDSVKNLSGDGVKDLKREYGAQRDVEKALARQYAIATRTPGAPLWEGLAYLHAAGDLMSGNLMGAAKAAATLTVGHRLQMLRDPGALLNQSFHGKQAFAPAEPIPQHVWTAETRRTSGQAGNGSGIYAGRYKRAGPWRTIHNADGAFAGREGASGGIYSRDSKAQATGAASKGLLPSSETKLPPTNIPPMVGEKFAREALGTVRDATKLGDRGRGGVSLGGEPPTSTNQRSSQTGPKLLPGGETKLPPKDAIRFVRPPERPAGAGKAAAPSEMHPAELAEIRKETGQPNMTAEDAHAYRIAKMARIAAEAKPKNDLEGRKRPGD